MTTAEKEKRYKYPLVNGRKIHARKVQMIIWGFIVGLLFAGFIAGIYWLTVEQLYPGGLSLKNWWDGGMGFIHSGNWPEYRHGWRDQIEPAAATIGVLSFLFGIKADAKDKKVHSLPMLIILGVTLLAVASAMAFGEVWLLHFGLPPFFRRTFHTAISPLEITIAGFALGVISGKILHYIWAPAAATVQYHLVEGPVSRGQTPLWVHLALAPPTLRERFADLQAKAKAGKVKLQEKDNASGMFRVALSLGILLFFAVAIIGNIAKYWIGKGHVMPVLHS